MQHNNTCSVSNRYSTAHHNTAHHNTAHHNTAHHNTAQHTTTLHFAALSVLYGKIQLIFQNFHHLKVFHYIFLENWLTLSYVRWCALC